jgi:hypothetical protein
VLGPRIFVVVEALPERSEAAFDLEHVSFKHEAALMRTYLQLPHRGLAEVLRAGIDAQRDQKPAIDALLAEALFTLLCTDDAVLLQFAGLALRLRLAPRLQGGIA